LYYRKLSTNSGSEGVGGGGVMLFGMNGLQIIFESCD
jgi:hypothetical protein